MVSFVPIARMGEGMLVVVTMEMMVEMISSGNRMPPPSPPLLPPVPARFNSGPTR